MAIIKCCIHRSCSSFYYQFLFFLLFMLNVSNVELHFKKLTNFIFMQQEWKHSG